MTQKNPFRIALLLYQGCMGTQVFGVAEVLRIGMDIGASLGEPKTPAFDIELIGLSGRQVNIAGGISVAARRPTGAYDLLIVPGLEISRHVDWDAKLAPLSREIAFIRKSFAAGTTVASACVGAFLLGEAGLLNGRRVTTAWLFTHILASRYPAAQLRPESVLLEDGAVMTTGAVSSVFDLALYLVKRALGAEVATATARVVLLREQRASQAPYVDTTLFGKSWPTFSQNLAQWFGARLTERYDLARVALAFHVSASTLLRRVKAETGDSPLTLLQKARVNKAKQLLTSTPWSIARITEEVGYSDVTTFSRLFLRHVGETPARHRRH